MLIQLYGFNWDVYKGQVMPAFMRWLVDGEESAISQLYQQTRCAREEQYLPPMLCSIRTWGRALAFVQRLPRGMHTRDEYRILCDAEQFITVSDQYIHRYPPQLYTQAEALRAVWGAVVETHCRWSFQGPEHHRGDQQGESEEQGVVLGRHPATLHLRGWLASCSVRAMALFELLACGRRRMPFGCRIGEPYEDYIGYLTPVEVQRLKEALPDIQLPVKTGITEHHMIDEIPPEHAARLLHMVHTAAQNNIGLLCRVG